MEKKGSTHAMLSLTHACNLKCRYCFVHQQPQYMTLETAIQAVNYLDSQRQFPNDRIHINFFGGEPLLMFDTIIKPVVEYTEKRNIPHVYSLTTNGLLLNDEIFDYLEQHNMNILLSIDGDKYTQDYNRPCHNSKLSSFDLIVNKIPRLLKMDPNSTFRSTLIPATCDRILENIQFAMDMGYTNMFLMPNVFEEWTEENWHTVQKQLRYYSNYYIYTLTNTKEIPFSFNPLMDLMQKYRVHVKEGRSMFYPKTCEECGRCGLGAPNTLYGIDPSGNIFTCQELTSNEPTLSPFCIGNIYDGIDEEKQKACINQYISRPITNQSNSCENCPMKDWCDGGCVANNFLLTGDTNIMPDAMCKWRQLLYNEIIYIENTLKEFQKEGE